MALGSTGTSPPSPSSFCKHPLSFPSIQLRLHSHGKPQSRCICPRACRRSCFCLNTRLVQHTLQLLLLHWLLLPLPVPWLQLPLQPWPSLLPPLQLLPWLQLLLQPSPKQLLPHPLPRQLPPQPLLVQLF